ncbi:tetratricopeptide repeat protein [Citreimonas salinaria]|uniref:Flp pilus assembly protein TadD, contains TPR repeats n=1 Tax=Citreimonas salinaria TaxID=321339 RepID=A0A1H3MHW8_9RHOB|nr:tetratricopeptide repeat protein [Citreimonas salinaria]SDY76226.1 Flp pilus assembly protein TadD, contains TPR repeats [Citreimonas salinaria]
MRHPVIATALAVTFGTLAGCSGTTDADLVERSLRGVNVVDESNLNEVMLTAGDPNEAVAYFQRTLTDNPERIDVRRGLAKSLVRARRIPEARTAWDAVVAHEDATHGDRVGLAETLIRAGEWDAAEATLNAIPPTYETHERYRLEAMVADSNQQWGKADSFYEIAAGLTDTPAPVLNNWGYSKLTRGDAPAAARLFTDAIRQDGTLFTAKNNLVMARGAQGDYTLPVIPMTQTERAQLLHTLGLAAIKRGDVQTGKSLLRDAIETHPQHFDAAARSLAALETGVAN